MVFQAEQKSIPAGPCSRPPTPDSLLPPKGTWNSRPAVGTLTSVGEGELHPEKAGQLFEGTFHAGGADLLLDNRFIAALDTQSDEQVPYGVWYAQYDPWSQSTATVVDLGLWQVQRVLAPGPDPRTHYHDRVQAVRRPLSPLPLDCANAIADNPCNNGLTNWTAGLRAVDLRRPG
jgi:hypothetical protein